MPTFTAVFEIIGFQAFAIEGELTNVLNRQEHNFKTILNEAVIAPHNRSVDDFPMDVLGFTQVLDTYVLWSPEPTHAYFVKLIMAAIIIMRISVDNGFALRGRIGLNDLDDVTMGALTFGNIFGPDFKQIYDQAKEQAWIGCTISENAIDVFHALAGKDDVSLDSLERNGMIARYPVPLLSGDVLNSYILNWPPDEIKSASLIGALKKYPDQKSNEEMLLILYHTQQFIAHLKGSSYN